VLPRLDVFRPRCQAETTGRECSHVNGVEESPESGPFASQGTRVGELSDPLGGDSELSGRFA